MTEPYCSFEVGQKVVCVDDSDQECGGRKDVLEGHIYTVRWVGISKRIFCVDGTVDGPGPSVRLDGIIRVENGYDVPFRADRFRPVRNIDTTQAVEALKEIVRREFDKVKA